MLLEAVQKAAFVCRAMSIQLWLSAARYVRIHLDNQFPVAAHRQVLQVDVGTLHAPDRTTKPSAIANYCMDPMNYFDASTGDAVWIFVCQQALQWWPNIPALHHPLE